MATEVAGRGEFAKTVTYHVLSDVNRNEFVAVVDSEGEPDEFEARLHVLMTELFFDSMASLTFLASLTLMNGPFLIERLIVV